MENIPNKRKCLRENDELSLPPSVTANCSRAFNGDSQELETVKGTNSIPLNDEQKKIINLNAIISLMDESSSSESDNEEELLIQDMMKTEDLHSSYTIFLLEGVKENLIRGHIRVAIANYSEDEFLSHFRVSKNVFENLCKRLSEWHDYKKLRYDKRLPETINMQVFLWFAAHEDCSYRDLSILFKLSTSSISRVVRRISVFISSLSPQFIKWPNKEKKVQSANIFGNKYSFSNAIGCVDVLRIAIESPKTEKDDYIDTEGNSSICMQAICDEKKKFIHIFVGYPGSCDNCLILKNSPIYQNLETYCEDYYLISNSKYPCNKNLITPYRDNGHLTPTQQHFNMKVVDSRVCIEQAFDMLQQRFKQLYYCKLRGMEIICHFIRACCVLHNICNEDDLSFELDNNLYITDNNTCSDDSCDGNYFRDIICGSMQN